MPLMRGLEQTSCLRLTSATVEIKFDEYLPECCIRSEKNRLTQVITNLINNAIKFTKEGNDSFRLSSFGERLSLFLCVRHGMRY